MNLIVCIGCGEHFYRSESSCPHCSEKTLGIHKKTQTAAALLLGLNLAGCSMVQEDLYGVPMQEFDSADMMIDADGDGFFKDEDCDDNNPDIHPDAEEIEEDGIDSNCNDEDDT